MYCEGSTTTTYASYFGPYDSYAAWFRNRESDDHTSTTPTSTVTTCALWTQDELLQTLKEMPQQNPQLPMQLSRVYEKVVKPKLEMHRTVAQNAFGTTSGAAKSAISSGAKGQNSSRSKGQPLFLVTQPSPVGTGTDSSEAAYGTPAESISEGVEPVEAERTQIMANEDWARAVATNDMGAQVNKGRIKLSIQLPKAPRSNRPCTHSPLVAKKPPGKKNMEATKAAMEKEKEKRQKAKEKAKAEKERGKANQFP